MENYSMHLPSYSIGSDVYANIYKFCRPYGTKAVVVGGHTAMSVAKDEILAAIAGTDLEITDWVWYGGEASYQNVAVLMENPIVQAADMIFAVGGGKALDTGKALAVKTEKPVFTFPTIAATCAATTTVALMYHPDGSFQEPFFFLEPAAHAFINSRIIAESPVKYLLAGLGDTTAKNYEATVSSRGEDLEHFNAVGVQISHMCTAPLVKYGQKAMADNAAKAVTYELEQIILAVIVTTGLVSIFVTREHTADYNSGLAHSIFYAMTHIPEFEKDHQHGVVVGFGVLLLLLCDEQYDEFEKIYQFNKSVGLPISLETVKVTPEQMEIVYPLVPQQKDIKHYPYPVTEQMVRDAFAKLAERNRQDA